MKVIRFFYLLLVGTIVLAGCGVVPVEPEELHTGAAPQSADDIAGVYRLVAVNGTRIPGTIMHDGVQLDVDSGVFSIGADGKITSQTVFTPPEGRRQERRVRATYTRDGSHLEMRWEGAGITHGSFDGEAFVMNNHGMILVYTRSGEIDPSVKLEQLGRCDAVGEPVRVLAGVFDNFDGELPVAADCYGISLGFFTFRDSAQTRVEISTTAAHPARPGEARDNRVLRLDLDVQGWAGVIHNFENEALDRWTPRNWRAFDSFAFWIHGNGSGTELFVDILDNRKPGSTHDDAERYTLTFTDNFSGWRKLIVPFRHMVHKPIGNRAPNDGLNLSAVHGWAFGSSRTDDPMIFYLDDFELLENGLDQGTAGQRSTVTLYPINETPMYSGRKKTPAERLADENFIEFMLNRYDSREDAAGAVAELGWKAYGDGDRRIAIKRFNQAWLLDPTNQYALWGFGVISADRGNIDDAVRYLQMAVDSGPPNPDLQRDYETVSKRLER